MQAGGGGALLKAPTTNFLSAIHSPSASSHTSAFRFPRVMSSIPPPVLENTPPPLPPPRRRSIAVDETRLRVHALQHADMSEISALRDMIEKRLGDSDQQKMDGLFAAFVDSLREAQVGVTTCANLVAFLQHPSNYNNVTPHFSL